MISLKKMFTASALASLLTAAAFAEAPRPNILIIMCDDLGYADVGFSGSPDIRTPEMDKLAASGTICTSAYVTHPFCGPSRMGLMAGRYPHNFGAQFNLPPVHLGMEAYNKLGIPESETLISTVLQNAGYTTGAIGKWHLGEEPEYHPNNRGFDDFYGFLGGGHNYFPDQYVAAYERLSKAGNRINDYLQPLQHNGKRTTETEYLTDALSKHAVGFVDAAAKEDKPFFLYLAYNAPHTPMEALESDMAPYANIANKKRRTVAGMMAAVDRGVGLISDALKANGQFDNTLIVFLSDNGGKPTSGSSNAPFRGEKGDAWEGGFRVPMFFHWPKHIPAQTFDYSVSSLDFYPTFAALAGAEVPSDQKLDGKNIYSNLVNAEDPRKGEMIYSMRHRNSYSDVSARSGDWKIVRFSNQPWRLFNIVADPGETKDLAVNHPERVDAMVKVAERWSHSHVQPLFFHAPQARDQWSANSMPQFDRTFQPMTGAFSLPPVHHVTDAPSVPSSASPVVSTVSTSGVKLKNGDTMKADFIAREKIKWEKNGWRWNQEKVESNFGEIDANGDGIASGLEKKAYWSK